MSESSDKSKHATQPYDIETMPPGIPYIIGNEMAERFSFYGMRCVLTIFMTQHLRNAAGQPNYLSDEDAKVIYHIFVASAYFFPILGSLLSDILWGKYKTILILSLGYCVGHACLAMGDTGAGAFLLSPFSWLLIGLAFIAIGSGGIKPCVSAHVGDQFGRRNTGLLSKVFSWFYFAINVGAAASNLLTPVLLEKVGPWAAFGLPGILMALATFVFWLGRNKFVHVPPAGPEKFGKETFSPDGIRALKNLSPMFLIFVPVFWSIFDQSGSEWVLQATRLDRHFLGIHWYESQIQFVNPVLILILIPTFSYFIYPAMGKFFTPTPLRKIGIGLFTAGFAFALSGWIESNIVGGHVAKSSSQADRRAWSAMNLLDGDSATSWMSGINAPDDSKLEEVKSDDEKSFFPQEIVIRLRENRPWAISSLRIQPIDIADGKVSEFLAEQEKKNTNDRLKKMIAGALPDSCLPKAIKIYTSDAPKPTNGWTEIASIQLEKNNKPINIEFGQVEAEYIKLSITENWGGPFVGLGDVSLFSDDPAAQANGELVDVAASGDPPNIGWQFLAYLILTAAEVMVSIVCLEFAYTQSPRAIKSFIMGVYLLGISLGNLLTAGVNLIIQNENGTSKLDGASYYWFFTAAMFITAIGYVLWSQFYRGQTYIQGEETT